MPRRKQDETPLLERVAGMILNDEYGERAAKDFLASLNYRVQQKWPPVVAVAKPTGKGRPVGSKNKPRSSPTNAQPQVITGPPDSALPYVPDAS